MSSLIGIALLTLASAAMIRGLVLPRADVCPVRVKKPVRVPPGHQRIARPFDEA